MALPIQSSVNQLLSTTAVLGGLAAHGYQQTEGYQHKQAVMKAERNLKNVTAVVNASLGQKDELGREIKANAMGGVAEAAEQVYKLDPTKHNLARYKMFLQMARGASANNNVTPEQAMDEMRQVGQTQLQQRDDYAKFIRSLPISEDRPGSYTAPRGKDLNKEDR